MHPLSLRQATLNVDTRAGPDVVEITGELSSLVTRAGIRDGLLQANVIGSTGSLTTIEFESGVVDDLRRAIARLAPPEADYAHDAAWGDDNGHSHVQAALIGPSISLAIRDGRLALGTWQQVVVINHDPRPRQRRIEVTLIGDVPDARQPSADPST